MPQEEKSHGLPATPERSKGFTLTELLISLLILAEIATFTIPKLLSNQQNSSYNANAKEVMGTIAAAYQVYSLANTPTAATSASDILAYMNYVSIDTTSTVDQSYTFGTRSCTTYFCYKLHNGGILASNNAFGGTSPANTINFLFDPDGTSDGTTNGPGKSLFIYLFFNGRINTFSTQNNVPSDPPWFSW
ncbi:type II secretion system protein [Vampirovibrio sp.]|uniref:type II secretion system protein n=1 Tax=Vampirovibrio sp. TaxID=2717857 RepID=UPI003593DC0A